MDKETRQKYGIQGEPIVADRVFVKDMNFDHDDVDAQSWMLIHGDQRTSVNTYDGNLGRKFNQDSLQWYPYDPENKKLSKKLEDYSEVDVADCPIAIAGEGAVESTEDDGLDLTEDLD